MKPHTLTISYKDADDKTCLINHEVKARDKHDASEQGYIWFASDRFKGCKVLQVLAEEKK